MTIDAKKLGLAGGLLWGVSMFSLTWAHIWFGYGGLFQLLLEELYIGYSPTPLGSLVGFAYGFADAGIGLFVFAWVYNRLHI